MDKPNNSLGGIPLSQIVDDMFKEVNAALDNKEDKEMQAMIATHGRNKVFCWLIGGAIRSVNPDGAEVVFKEGDKVIHTVPDVSHHIKRPLQD